MIRFFDGTVARRVEALVALFVLCSAVPLTQAQAEGCYPITAQDLRRPNVPRFDQYSVPVPQVTPAPVDLNSHPSARRYRSVLRAGAGKGPNFARI